MKFLASLALSAPFVTTAFAQTISIQAPADGSTVQAGSSIIVEVIQHIQHKRERDATQEMAVTAQSFKVAIEKQGVVFTDGSTIASKSSNLKVLRCGKFKSAASKSQRRGKICPFEGQGIPHGAPPRNWQVGVDAVLAGIARRLKEHGQRLPEHHIRFLVGNISVLSRRVCAIPTTLMGEKIEVGKDMDTETRKLPLGVCVSIAVFNFPAWALPFPALFHQLNLEINAGGTKNGKRVQCNMGIKNHVGVRSDANKDQALNALMEAAGGAAGQRSVAISVACLNREKRTAILFSFDADTEWTVTTPAALARIEGLVASADNAGAKTKILLDGRGVQVPEYPAWNWVGATIIEVGSTELAAYKEEIFGPVLCVLSVPTLDAAIAVLNANPFGNGAAIFTQSGPIARKFETEMEAGQIGVNVPIPVPLPMFSWTGNKASFLGDINFYGKGGINFYTQTKTTTTLWRSDDAHVDGEGGGGGASVNMPVLK
ncbi:Aldehyde/histidinol dehydrogenase [Mycena galopus ATCC 62051]|nr:Aldehyde/histidinol dehydrogenase [Mycena galopus ATCC 62051]